MSGTTLARRTRQAGTVPSLRLSNGMAALAGGLWVLAIVIGFSFLLRYKNTPSEQGRPPAQWPAASAVPRNPIGATLVMFVHPRCPCTQASISELARLLAVAPVSLKTEVVVAEPEGVPEGWTDTELVRRASAIQGVHVMRDEAGREAARFHAVASGLAVLYDESGRRLFSGGITPSRGHEGDSFGRRRLLAVLSGRSPDRDVSPVFGCALGTRASRPSGT